MEELTGSENSHREREREEGEVSHRFSLWNQCEAEVSLRHLQAARAHRHLYAHPCHAYPASIFLMVCSRSPAPLPKSFHLPPFFLRLWLLCLHPPSFLPLLINIASTSSHTLPSPTLCSLAFNPVSVSLSPLLSPQCKYTIILHIPLHEWRKLGE